MSKRVTIRLGEPERVIVEGVAEHLEISSSEVIRLAIRALWDEQRVISQVAQVAHRDSATEEKSVLDKCIAEIRRVGVNVNQVVRAAHCAGWTDDQIPSVNTLPRMLEGLVETLEREVRRVC